MAINHYGVWVASPARVQREHSQRDSEPLHLHLFYNDGTGGSFGRARRASINVRSKAPVSELVYWCVEDFQHPVTGELRRLLPGFTAIPPRPGGLALDYLRGGLLDLTEGHVLPHHSPGPCDDIIDFVLPQLEHAIEREATLYLFGEPYDNLQGMHNLHMNQGSVGRFARHNGTWRDGAVLIGFPDTGSFSAIFLAFASQAIHTDETTGNALPGSPNFATLLAGRTPGPTSCRIEPPSAEG